MLEAERNARPTASGKVVLEQEGVSEAPGFIIYMPVYGASPEGRALRGFIYSPFNAEDFLASALELESVGNYTIRLYDRDFEPDRLMAGYNAQAPGGHVWQQALTIANHSWVLRVEGGPVNALSSLSMVTLVFGLLVAGLKYGTPDDLMNGSAAAF